MNQDRYVYVVHGFGQVRVFATLVAAEQYRDRYASACDITRERVRIVGK